CTVGIAVRIGESVAREQRQVATDVRAQIESDLVANRAAVGLHFENWSLVRKREHQVAAIKQRRVYVSRAKQVNSASPPITNRPHHLPWKLPVITNISDHHVRILKPLLLDVDRRSSGHRAGEIARNIGKERGRKDHKLLLVLAVQPRGVGGYAAVEAVEEDSRAGSYRALAGFVRRKRNAYARSEIQTILQVRLKLVSQAIRHGQAGGNLPVVLHVPAKDPLRETDERVAPNYRELRPVIPGHTL